MSAEPESVVQAAVAALRAAAPNEKCAAAAKAKEMLGHAPLKTPDDPAPPDQPGRPQAPVLKPPRDVPRRRLGSVEGRTALLHAIAHIEFNAIDLAFDMAARFAPEIQRLGLDEAKFIEDWVRIGEEEARHFNMVQARLQELGSSYGALPAHNGLWDAAEKTRESVLARLVVAPLILEARGLDVTPGMIVKLNDVGDAESAAVLQVIYDEEIGHVAAGERWFHAICHAQGAPAAETFLRLQRTYFPAGTKPPFNHSARARAGLPREYYDRINEKFFPD